MKIRTGVRLVTGGLIGFGVLGLMGETIKREPKITFAQETYSQSRPSNPNCGSIVDPLNSASYVSEEESYPSFRFPGELENILKHSERIGIEPELLMAIRMAENGNPGREYGILPTGSQIERYANDRGYNLNGEFVQYLNETEKQMCWAAWTIERNEGRCPENQDFIAFLADRFAPVGVDNDPNNLNHNWESNVRHWYNRFKEEASD